MSAGDLNPDWLSCASAFQICTRVGLTATRSVCRASGFVVCWACSAVWRWKSSGQPDGGEGL